MLLFFFFSSSRRHTRSLLDWSSDVCSSDLEPLQPGLGEHGVRDARVTYAVLTEAGLERFRTARRTHMRDVAQLFDSRFEAAERDQLAALLARLPEPDEDELACTAEPE